MRMYFHFLHVATVIMNRNRKVDSHECHAHFIGKSALLSFARTLPQEVASRMGAHYLSRRPRTIIKMRGVFRFHANARAGRTRGERAEE